MALDIRYARSGGVSIAYQVVGDGDVELVCVPDYVSNLVYALVAALLRRRRRGARPRGERWFLDLTAWQTR